MTDDRELRDLLEKLQVENTALRKRVLKTDELHTRVKALEKDNAALKRQLELADEARDKWGEKLARMQRKDLEAHVKSLEANTSSLERQLELADEVRDTWYRDAARLRRELEIAREEQLRLRRIVDQERLDHRRELKRLRKR